MTLSQEDGQLYYKLWLPLLDFVNQKYHINEELENMATAKGLNPVEVKEVADKLWSDVGIIDLYLEEHPELAENNRDIILGWKRRIQGQFIMERHLKKGTIFISMDDQEVYQVKGIISSWDEMFYGASLPMVIEVTFIPFRDVIISDGLVMPYNIIVGSGIKRRMKNIYMDAKKNNRIHRSL